MSDLEKVMEELKKLTGGIADIVKGSTYDKYDDLSGLKINHEDAEQLFLLEEARTILARLYDVNLDISYLKRPVKFTGFLEKNDKGRYEVNGVEFTSGNGIEAYVLHSVYDSYYWTKTRIEHDGNDYYLVGNRDVPLQGLRVRIR